MKYLLILLLIGCSKSSDDFTFFGESKAKTYQTSIYLGQDQTITRTDSFAFTEYTSYLATCGVNEGIKIYPILFPSYVWIKWTDYQGRQIPYALGLTTGTYKFVGCAYSIGLCNGEYRDIQVFDTMTLTVLKKHRYGR